jgi:hypothetical protein
LCRFPVGEAKLIRGTEFGIACAPGFGDLDKAERLAFTDRRGDSMPVDTVVLEILECQRQATVIFSAVVRNFDFEAGEDAMARLA